MNKLLARQLKKLNMDSANLPDSIESWNIFLKTVENTYTQNEKDRYLTERSFEISSQEIRDQIQQNKEMSAHLAQSSKLAAIGTLASGVAHELNNPLAAVRGYVELLLRSCRNADPAAYDTLKRIVYLTERMAKISGQLLNLSHKSNIDEIGICSLKDSISDIVDLTYKQFQLNEISIQIDYSATDFVVCGDLTRMAGVFQNLLNNSSDAFLSNPSLTRKSQIEIAVADASDSSYLDITYKDNAGGIPADVLPRIFDPFFTTKGVGGGTGLGLSLIRSSLEEIDGSISVLVEDRCTIFKIRLKKSDEKIKNDRKVTHLPLQEKILSLSGKPKILFISNDKAQSFPADFKSYLQVRAIKTDSTELGSINIEDRFDFLIIDGVQGYSPIRRVVENMVVSRPEAKLVVLGATQAECDAIEVFKNSSYLLIEKPIGSRAEFLFKLNEFMSQIPQSLVAVS